MLRVSAYISVTSLTISPSRAANVRHVIHPAESVSEEALISVRLVAQGSIWRYQAARLLQLK